MLTFVFRWFFQPSTAEGIMRPSLGLFGCPASDQMSQAIARAFDLYFLAQSAKHCLRNNKGRMKPCKRGIYYKGGRLASFYLPDGHDRGFWCVYERFLKEENVPADLLAVMMGETMGVMNGRAIDRRGLTDTIFQKLEESCRVRQKN